jgi:hypothetical protein
MGMLIFLTVQFMVINRITLTNLNLALLYPGNLKAFNKI